jgi:arylsulfatase A-like enzyme
MAPSSHPATVVSVSTKDASPAAAIDDDEDDDDWYDDEERARQALHESVTDPYDPLVPNDLQQYLEVQAAQRHQEELERQRREALEQQERIRRHEILATARHHQHEHADEKFDQGRGDNADRRYELRQQQQEGAAASRGRGRGGISNLPAWMQKQRE